MEIPFKKIELEDKALIDSYLQKKAYRSCDMSYSNLYLWGRFYKTRFAVVENTLVFSTQQEGDDLRITFPVGEETWIKKALPVLFEYFKERGLPIRLHLVLESEFEQLERWYPGRFEINYDRDVADYVYETEKLVALSGKKYHSKKNHINNFKKQYPDWSYEKISSDNLEECFQMSLDWRRENDCECDQEKRNEMCVAQNSLRLLEELNLVGGLIRAEGNVVAFSIGESLNPDTFVVHIEKAYADVQGAYPMINQQFLEHEAQGFTYVNREDDTGVEGLRQAKLSYKPVFLVNKGIVTEKKEEM